MFQHQKVVLVAGASVALVVAVSVFIYLRKRQEEEDENEQQHDDKEELEFADLNTRESVASAGQSIVKVKVPQHVVGIIIGREGSNIKQLRAEFGVRFNFERIESTEKNQLNEDTKKLDRLLEIRGQREKVRDAEQKIHAIIAETPKYVETEVVVPTDTCGRIIGKGGQNIRDMCSASGARIVVDRNELHSLGNQRRIAISGTTVQVEYAKLLIKEKVEQAKADSYKYGSNGEFKAKNFYNFPHVTLPNNGEYFQVFVSSSKSPHHFWVQLISKESTKLDMMTKELSEVYGQLKSDEDRLETGNIGDLCVAPYDEDGEWYRAAISKLNQDRTADVFYFDYGDNGSVNIDEIKTIRPKFKDLNAQAVLCKLPIKPSAGDDWSEEVTEEFRNLTYCAQWKPIMSRVIRVERTEDSIIPILQIIDTSQDQDIDVSASLVQKGYAVNDEPVSNDTNIDDNENDISSLAKGGLTIVEDVINAVDENAQQLLESVPIEIEPLVGVVTPTVHDVACEYEDEPTRDVVVEDEINAVVEDVQEHEFGFSDIAFENEVDTTVVSATDSLLSELNDHSAEEEHFALITESELQLVDDANEEVTEKELKENPIDSDVNVLEKNTGTIKKRSSLPGDLSFTSPDDSSDLDKNHDIKDVQVHTVFSYLIQSRPLENIKIGISESVFTQEVIIEVDSQNTSADVIEALEDNSNCLDGESIISLSSSFERDAIESIDENEVAEVPDIKSEPELIISVEEGLSTSKDDHSNDDESSGGDDSCDSGVKCEHNDQNVGDSGSYESSLVEDEDEGKLDVDKPADAQNMSFVNHTDIGKFESNDKIIYEKIVPSPKRSSVNKWNDEESHRTEVNDEYDAKVVNGSFSCNVVRESECESGVTTYFEKDPPAVLRTSEKISLSTDDLLKNSEIILNKVDCHLRSTIQQHDKTLDTKSLDIKTSSPYSAITKHSESVSMTVDQNSDELDYSTATNDTVTDRPTNEKNSTNFTRSDSDDYVDIDIKTIGGSVIAYVSDTNLNSAGQAVDAKQPNESRSKVEEELQRSLDETSRKNVHKNSMEMARENLLTIKTSNESDDESYFSAQSDVTLTSGQSEEEEGLNYYTAESDNLSFFTADSRAMSPSSDSFFSIPSPRGSKLSMISIESPEPRLSGSYPNFEGNADERTNLFKSNESILSSERKLNVEEDEVGKETTV